MLPDGSMTYDVQLRVRQRDHSWNKAYNPITGKWEYLTSKIDGSHLLPLKAYKAAAGVAGLMAPALPPAP